MRHMRSVMVRDTLTAYSKTDTEKDIKLINGLLDKAKEKIVAEYGQIDEKDIINIQTIRDAIPYDGDSLAFSGEVYVQIAVIIYIYVDAGSE